LLGGRTALDQRLTGAEVALDAAVGEAAVGRPRPFPCTRTDPAPRTRRSVSGLATPSVFG
ncbi:hypothetical protein AB0P45_35355, partial [Streptomyces niveus]|uniref:hypothetical protein n=1 Tax=Streptomyces niveus TaxID=193462 RepID=UPI003442F51F